jgi:anti-anti-sigma factor
MKFKIDTRERLRIITIEANQFDANLAEMITSALQSTDEHTPESLIINLQNVATIDDAGVEEICNIYRRCYAHHASCCLASPQKEIIDKLERKGLELNVAPTLREAIDIVMMEEVERDLFNEDEDENA